MGLVGRSSWAFFKTVPTIHRRHSEPRTESMCLHYNMYNTCSRNLQNLFDRSVWEPDGYADAKDLFAKGQKNRGKTVESVCHRSEPVLLLSQCLPVYPCTNVKVQHQVCRKGSNRNESAWTASFQPFPVRSPCLEKMRGDDPIPQLTTASKEDSNLIPAPTAFVIMLWWVFDIQC